MNRKTGTLYIVATPIGNLGDMTERAVTILKQADLILAEDTRHGGILLKAFDIQGSVWSCHEHNERKQLPRILERLQQGDAVALISDAGTPLISDPGYPLVNAARDAGIDVIPIPGACAVITALSVSGLPTDRFCFEGFIPSKAGARKRYLEERKNEVRTMVFYESSHRIVDSLKDIGLAMGNVRQIVVARELTKKFEQFYRGNALEVVAQITASSNDQKGEFVVMVEGNTVVDQDDVAAEKLLNLLIKELSLKTACKIAAEWLGRNRNELYQLGLQQRRESADIE